MDGSTLKAVRQEALGLDASREVREGAVIPLPLNNSHSVYLSESITSGVFRGIDAAVLVSIEIALYLFYVGWDLGTSRMYFTAIVVHIGFTISVMQYANLYNFNTIVAWPSRMRHMVMIYGAVALLIVGAAFALKISDQFSRVWFFCSVLAAALTTFAARGVGKLMISRMARAGKLVRNMAIVGASGQAEHLVARLRQHDVPWKRIVGIFDDRRTRISQEIDGFPVLGNLDDLVTYVRRGFIHDVVITLPWSADERLISIVSRLRALPVHIYLGSDLIGYHFPRHRELMLEGVPVLEIASAPLTGWSGIVKWVEDKATTTLVLLLTSPLLALIALAIKIDSAGPVFFRQKRFGFNNKLIEVWKFRSMQHHLCDNGGARQTCRNDPRITRVGAFLRRYSLDELPQLINVLKGEMSIVGPRPHAVQSKAGGRLFEDVVAEYAVRHKVKPGITGWAQVNGLRGEIDADEKIVKRVEYDLFYIENWSLWLDLKILLLTLWVGVKADNAY